MGRAQTLPSGERGGEFVKGESGAALDKRRGRQPPNPLVQNGGEATDLINTAQVTPFHEGRVREAKRRAGKVRRQHRLYDVRYVRDLARQGIGRGFQQTGPLRGEWDLAPSCQAPVPVQMDGAPRALDKGRHVRVNGPGYGLTLWTKCRKCADCLRRRRNLWAYRAQQEIAAWSRTWFATFTLAPHQHAVMRMRASVRLADRGTDLERLPDDDKSHEVAAEYRRELTLYFKRLRKQTKASIRYILVQEQHKSGLPHFHALIHEVNPLSPIRHADLTSQWKLGYTKFKLCEGVKTAWYVAKYLAKAVDNRVRASLRYGFTDDALKHSARSANVTKPGPAKTESLWCQSTGMPVHLVRMDKSRETVVEFNTPEEKLDGLRRILQKHKDRSSPFAHKANNRAHQDPDPDVEASDTARAAFARLFNTGDAKKAQCWYRSPNDPRTGLPRYATWSPVPPVVYAKRL